MTPSEAAAAIEVIVNDKVKDIEGQIDARLIRAGNEMRNQALTVLANPSPSAPGNPPGVRSGDLRRNWSNISSAGSRTVAIKSGMGYSGYLEHGTHKMAPRPYAEKIKAASLPKLQEIFNEIR